MSEVSGHVVGESPLRIWGLPSALRLRRQLERAGAGAGESFADRVVSLRADWVYDQAIVRGLVAAHEDCALVADGGKCVGVSIRAERRDETATTLAAYGVPPGVRAVSVAEVASGYDDKLRKRELPYLMPLTSETLPAVERRVFGGAYKGVTDAVTLYLWPAPARAATRFCARHRITPNQVTFASLLLVLAAMWLFWTGRYGLGLVAAWAMTFLDTVDGKLARVTLQSTRFGDVFDHGIDLIHPPFWWWTWMVGLPAAGWQLADPSPVLTALVAGYVLQRLEEGVFIAWFRMDMHTWQRFDSRFRLITARRNPNLVILTVAAVAGRPDIGIVAVAVWTMLSLLIHTVRLTQAAWVRRQRPLRSWLAP
ncbi:MAG: CDP-alcohol phosphatidyltransferase family protein [Betaproteobacteria bacterium]|nr:CDP-alcohol phosphatidyltransferase family protein [Betaproteobacteria bacterium]